MSYNVCHDIENASFHIFSYIDHFNN
ncbi:MAG: hypothetical protein GW938_01655 [Leptospira sp.]|nr:hypothetical protein [Leptospira sp.]NCS92474.1 hypothetical protein [Leptospira sp.]